jgi:hypothetical protein
MTRRSLVPEHEPPAFVIHPRGDREARGVAEQGDAGRLVEVAGNAADIADSQLGLLHVGVDRALDLRHGQSGRLLLSSDEDREERGGKGREQEGVRGH